jgi:hypothetical protein
LALERCQEDRRRTNRVPAEYRVVAGRKMREVTWVMWRNRRLNGVEAFVQAQAK